MAASHLFLLLVVLMTYQLTQSAILRPNWFPYFRDEPQSGRGVTISTRHGRNNGRAMNCPPDISEYECYHELMAVWTRVLAKEKRDGAFSNGQIGRK